MLSLDATQLAIVASDYKLTSRLFKVVDSAGPTTYRWSTITRSYGGNDYTYKINPDTFEEVTLNRAKSEIGIQAPNDLSFVVDNPDNVLTASNFIDGSVTLYLVVSDGTNESTIATWKFNIKQCEPVYQQLHFTCEDFIQKHLEGDYPNTKLIKDINPSNDPDIDDNICVPIPFGTCYIPLRSLYITDQRYYLLGPTAGSLTYSISKVHSPHSVGASEWDSGSFSFTQSTKTIDAVDWRVFQPIIADSDGDGVADASGLFKPGEHFLDILTKFSRNDTEDIDGSQTGAHDGAGNAAILTDTGASWGVDKLIGMYVVNRTDSSYGKITDNTATTVTAALAGGTDNDWDVGDAYTIGGPASILRFFFIDIGISASDIDDATFGASELAFAGWGLTFNGAFYYKQPKEEVLAILLNMCHSTLRVTDKIELHVLSKTSQKTITKADVLRASKTGEGTFRYSLITQEQSDSGYIAFQESGKPQDEFIKALIPAKASTNNISGDIVEIPFVQDSQDAQRIGTLKYQREFLKKANISFVNKGGTLLALQPDDVITINHADYGGNYAVLVDSMTIKKDLAIEFSCIQFSESLDDWADLAPNVITIAADDSGTYWAPVISGPDGNPTVGDAPSILTGFLIVGNTANRIIVDPATPIIKVDEGGTDRVLVGKLAANEYGIRGNDAAGNLLFKIDTSGAEIAGWTIGQTTLANSTNIILDASNKKISIKSAAFGNDGIQLDYNAGNPRAYIGDGANQYLNFDGANLSWKGTNTELTAAGQLSVSNIVATGGTIGGWTIAATTLSSANIILDQANDKITVNTITIDGANDRIRSGNYIAGAAGVGFTLGPDLLEVGNIACRGILRFAVFQTDVISVVGGNMMIRPGDVLATDMTAADVSTLTIEGNETFAVNDILRIKDETDDEWLLVTNIASAPTYTVTRDQATAYGADANPAWKKGASVVNYGPSGDGGILLTSSEANAPYMSVFTHAGSPWTTLITRLRIGNLNGFLGYLSDLYGIAIGETNKYLKYDPTNGLRIAGAVAITGTLSSSDWAAAAGVRLDLDNKWLKMGGSNVTAAGAAAGVFLGLDASYKFYVGDGANDYFQFDGTNVTISTSVADAIIIKSGADIKVEAGGDVKLIGSDSDPGRIKYIGSSYTVDMGLDVSGAIFTIIPLTVDVVDFCIGAGDATWAVDYPFKKVKIVGTEEVFLYAKTTSPANRYAKVVADVLSQTVQTAYLYVYDGTSARQVTLRASTTADHTLRPNGAKTLDFGDSTYCWNDAYADDWHNVADFYNLDAEDDLATIRAIKGSGIMDERTGLELIDDDTLPIWMLGKHKSSGEEREQIELEDGTVEEGKVIKIWKKGDTMYDLDGKPYLSMKMCDSLSWGAIRQLDAKIQELDTKLEALQK